MSLVQRLKDEATYSSTFAKGQRLNRTSGVLSCDVEPGLDGSSMHVSGLVRLSEPGKAYRAQVSLDIDEADIVDYSCTCPIGSNAFGMCKHEIALALNYLDNGGTVRTAGTSGRGAGARAGAASGARSGQSNDGGAAEASGARSGQGNSGAAGGYGGRSGQGGDGGSSGAGGRHSGGSLRPYYRGGGALRTDYVAPTSSQVSNLIAAVTAERAERASRSRGLRAAQDGAAAEPVELLAGLSPASTETYRSEAAQTWLLKLRVRRGKAIYVVKNVAELARAYLGRYEYSYGKRLSFVHEPEAFDERSRHILEFVTRIVRSQQALFLSRYNYMDAGRGADVKELPLAWSDVVELLDLLQGSVVEFEPGGYPPRDKRTLRVTSGTPVVSARLEPGSSGGYDLSLPSNLDCFLSGEALYLLDGEAAWRCEAEYARKAAEVLVRLLPCTRPLHIAKADLPEFCRAVLPALSEVTRLDAPSELYALVPPEPEFCFQIGLEDGEVRCQAFVSYGEARLGLYEPKRPGQPPRDQVAEYHAQDVVEAYFAGTGDDLHFDESDDELLYLLLTDGLAEMGELGEVLLSERLRAIEVRDAPQVRVKATVKSGLLDVAVDSSGMSAQDLAAYLASYKRKQRYLRLSTGDIVRIGDNLRSLDSLAQGLGADVSELAQGVHGLDQNKALFVDALLKREGQVRLDRSAGFRAIVREFETYSDADIEMPPSLADVLRSYQETGVRWLGTLERFGFGGILADDMGLGKTLQVIAHVLARKEAADEGAASGGAAAEGEAAAGRATDEGPVGRAAAEGETAAVGRAADAAAACARAPRETTLVVAPASLVYNWCAEFARFAPTLDVVPVVGGKAARTRIIGATAEHDVLVTSYDLMKRDVEAYTAQHFRRVILDEAQYIKNAGTQAAKCARCLPSDVRFALTGTPIENRLSELWSIFEFLMPGILGTREQFSKRFESPVEHGELEATRRLQCLVAPFILRRLKADVLADLPEKNESVVLAQMTGEQSKLYRANQDRLALQIQHKLPDEFKKEKLKVLAELTKLRQICCDPRLFYADYHGGSAKLDACAELVRNAVDGGHAVLVFSQFTSMLDLLAERLRAEKLRFLVLTGSTSKEERERLVAAFQTGEAKVFLISLKAGGVGLNLTAADVVIHYDPWWNLAAQNQATDRAHRIGQERAVSVFKLIAKDSIEERIVEMQGRKADLAEAVLGGEGLSSSRITQDDILALLGSGE